MLIVRRSKLYYTASGIITPIGGRPVHRCKISVCCSNGTPRLSYLLVLWVIEGGMGLVEHCGEQNYG